MVESRIFATTGQIIEQKSAYPIGYLSKYWIDLQEVFTFGRNIYGDYYVDIIFAVAQGTLLWKQFILGAICKRRN